MSHTVQSTQLAANVGVSKPAVFLSYSRKNLEFAQILSHALEKNGYEVLLDKTDIAIGEDWQRRLEALIMQADTVVFCVSKPSCVSSICAWEVEKSQQLGKRIIPIVIEQVAAKKIPQPLAKLNFLFLEGRAFSDVIADLCTALESDLPWLRLSTRLSVLAEDWQKSSRRSQILRGSALDEAEHWMANRPANVANVNELQKQLIAASRKAATNRLRNRAAGALGVAAMAVGLSIWGEINRESAVEQAKIAEARTKETTQMLATATKTANTVVTNLAKRFRDQRGIPHATLSAIINDARSLQYDLVEVAPNDTSLGEGMATTAVEIAKTMHRQGLAGEALGYLDQAYQSYDLLENKEPKNRRWQKGKALAMQMKGEFLVETSKVKPLENAKTWLEPAISLIEKNLIAAPDDKEWLFLLAKSQRALGSAELRLGNLYRATTFLQTALTTSQKILPDDLKANSTIDGKVNFDLPITGSYGSTDGPSEERSPVPDILFWVQEKGKIYEALGDVAITKNESLEALNNYVAATAAYATVLASDFSNAAWGWDAWRIHIKFGDVLLQDNDAIGAGNSYAAAYTTTQSILPEQSENNDLKRIAVVTALRLGDANKARGEIATAKIFYTEGVRIAKNIDKYDILNIPKYDLAIANIKLASVDPENSLKLMNEARAKLNILDSDNARAAPRSEADLLALDIPIEPNLP